MKKSAFTLIELLVVIVIIGILATIGVAQFNGYQDEARYAKHLAEISQSKKEALAEIYANGQALGEEEFNNYQLSDVDSNSFPDNFAEYQYGGTLDVSGYTADGNFYFGTNTDATGIFQNGIPVGKMFIEMRYRRLTQNYVPLKTSHNNWKTITTEDDLSNRWYTRFVIIDKTNLDSNVYLGRFDTVEHNGYSEYEIDWWSVRFIK